MSILISCAVFLLLAIVLPLVGMKLDIRPREAMERVAGTAPEHHEIAPSHPSLVFRDLVKRLGTLVPVSPKDVTVMQRRLIRAGYRKDNALKVLYGAKLILGVLLPVFTVFMLSKSDAEAGNKTMYVVASAVIGFFGPNEFVHRR